MKYTARYGDVTITANVWQDPLGPNHKYFITREHLTYPDNLPQESPRSDYLAMKVIADKPNAIDEFKVAVPKLSVMSFSAKYLGIDVESYWWNEYQENKDENDEKYEKYVQTTCRAYFQDFLSRMDLPEILGAYLFNDSYRKAP